MSVIETTIPPVVWIQATDCHEVLFKSILFPFLVKQVLCGIDLGDFRIFWVWAHVSATQLWRGAYRYERLFDHDSRHFPRNLTW